MKILYHHRTASRDGQAVHIDEMIAALRAAGHDVKVVAPAAHSGSKIGTEVGWVRRLRAALPKAAYELLELSYSLVAWRQLERAAAAFEPDVVYERYNLYLLAGVLFRWRHGTPLLLEVNAPLAEERGRFGGLALPRFGRWAESLVWRRADAVLPVTHVLASRIAATGVAHERLHVIPNGINTQHFEAAPRPSEAKARLGLGDHLVLGFTGFVRPWHGVDRVVRWLASPVAPHRALLLVVGDGPARAGLEALAARLGVGGRVRFTGVVAPEAIPLHVAAFDIALQPAVVDYASPLKLFEYLALGKAVIAPRQPNIEEVLVHGSNALLFDPSDDEGIESALTRLCDDLVLRAALGREAQATIARGGFTWSANADRVASIALGLTARGEAASSRAELAPRRPRSP